MTPAELLRRLFDTAVAAAEPMQCVPPHLPPPPKGRTLVVAAGKAAASMARAVEEHWPGPVEGIAVTRYGHGIPCREIEVIEAGHPLPDAAGERAARRILGMAAALGAEDLLLCLLSGGGSALLGVPAPGLRLSHKRSIADALMRAGADISEINAVRKHLSAIKGGRLAHAAAPARVVTLAISDVPGDDISIIASGPTVADPTTLADARAVLDKYAITPPAAAAHHLRDPASETPKELCGCEAIIVARPADALAAAAVAARVGGVTPVILGDKIEGEAVAVARQHAALALSATRIPCVLLSGGEVTVTLGNARGAGGPNSECALALMVALDGSPGIYGLAADTDGIDGSGDNAGAWFGPDALGRLRELGYDAGALLREHRSHECFAAIDGLVVTGPTLTNVNDFRAVMITADAKPKTEP